MNQNPYEPPQSNAEPPHKAATGKVWVQVDEKWVGRLNSPLFVVVSALTGVSISFAPLALLKIGSMQLTPAYHWTVAGICFAMIFFVPGFYMWLDRDVIKQLHSNGDRRTVKQDVAEILEIPESNQ